jgi:hypothetical protein
VHEVPRIELPLLVLDDQDAAAREHEEVLLAVLAVVVAETLARLENADVEPELAKRPLALEVAVHAERARVPPPSLAGIDDEPAIDIRDQPELGFA